VPFSQFPSFVPLFVCLVTMPAAISFDRLLGANALIGSVWLDATAPTLSPKPLPSLVVSSGLIEASQAKCTYGHWRTKTQCKSDPQLHYWKSPRELPIYLTSRATALHPTTPMTTPGVRLCQLHTEPIGSILLVVQAVSPGSFPFITLVAAPSMATLGARSPGNPPGILLADIWQASVLQPFASIVDMEHPHCPILAASEGFSRATTPPTPELYLADSKPLFFLAGELFSKSVEIEPGDLTY
jgi:hypothetical protein